MGISVEELVERYPTLYHMATEGSWDTIRKHGLLSSVALCDLFEVEEPRRTTLLTTQRTKMEPLGPPNASSATLRDQKVLSQKNLDRCLTGCSPSEWYSILNERVFFWLNRDRLMGLMSAKEYHGKPHTVLEVDASGLVRRYADRIQLAAMNTGNTLPYPHPRGPETFRTLADFPYEKRKRLDDYSAVVELTVMGGVSDIRDYVLKAEHARVVNGKYESQKVLFAK